MSLFRLQRGIIPPLVTPLNADQKLDRDGFKNVIDRVIDGGVVGIFVLGTTGEAPSLSQAVQRDVVASACEFAAGRVPVLVGISHPSLDESLSLARHARENGAKAVVAAAPFYFPITQRDLATYFLTLAEASPLPVYLYNMPSCVDVSIEPVTLDALTRSPNIVGVKDSSGDMDYFRRLLQFRAARPDWAFLIGPEHLLAEATLAGGDGGITGGANVVPRLFVQQFVASDRRDRDEVARLQERVLQFGRIYQVGDDFMSVSRGLKCALAHLKVCGETMAPPFHTYDDERRRNIVRILESLDWLPGPQSA